ncbi:Low-specificity L-threonine aldolase [hydrothermal vent metagenome]|uniref:Low-specificity L-threonine aldolase n=1 Tax=hydrothermal vent metagenome TaxID=652676 RepID=A0A3B0UA43_9ZZZZ
MNQYAQMKHTGTASCVCDLRSDTVTSPDDAMRDAIANARVGDDVYEEDPSILQLEGEMAARLGKEAGLFFPSGTQSNLAAMMAHCARGDEIIVGKDYHVYSDEAAGASVLASISLCPVPTQPGGEIHPDIVAAAIKDDDVHYARTRLLCLENTVGGKAIPVDKMRAASAIAKENGLLVHLDGARIFNAISALECEANQLVAKELASVADTISVCLSKGLGAPAGSVLVGDAPTIKRALRNRKILGGGMRQAGFLAAAGLYALEHNITDLMDDHKRATRLGKCLTDLAVGDVEVHTNMVFFTPAPQHHAPLCAHMTNLGIRIGEQSPSIRLVLHRDVDDGALDHAIEGFKSYYEGA